MIFSNKIDSKKINKAGSTLDITPTLLNFFGETGRSFGFGRDLIGNLSTLTEIYPDINKILDENSNYITSLWNFPEIFDGIEIDTVTNKLRLKWRGRGLAFIFCRIWIDQCQRYRYISYPTLLILDKDLKVKEAKFDFYSHEPLIRKVSKLNYNQRFLWVDQCEKNSFFTSSISIDFQGHCMAFGALGGDQINVIKLKNNKIIKFDYMNSFFKNLNLNDRNYKKRETSIDRMNKYGTNKVIEKSLASAIKKRVIIVSGGKGSYISEGYWGSSYIRNMNSNIQINLKRGFTVVGLDENANPIFLDSVDTCNAKNNNAFTGSDYFKKIIDDSSHLYDIFAIITNDTAVCGNFNLEPLFHGTGFTKWKKIKYGEPYIGLMMNDGNITEYNGKKVIKLEIQ